MNKGVINKGLLNHLKISSYPKKINKAQTALGTPKISVWFLALIAFSISSEVYLSNSYLILLSSASFNNLGLSASSKALKPSSAEGAFFS